MALLKEIVLVLMITHIEIFNAGIITDEVEPIFESSNEKEETVTPVRILLSLTNYGGELSKTTKKDLSMFLQEAFDLDNSTIKNLESIGPFLKMFLSAMADIKGVPIYKNVKYDRIHNAILVFVMYDILGQILNEFHEDNFLTIQIGEDKPKTSSQKKVLALLSAIIGETVALPNGDLDKFYLGSSEEVQRRTDALQKFKAEFISCIQNHVFQS